MAGQRMRPAATLVVGVAVAYVAGLYRATLPSDLTNVLLAIVVVNALAMPFLIAYSARATVPERVWKSVESLPRWRREPTLRQLGITQKGLFKQFREYEFYPRLLRLVWRAENLMVDVVVITPLYFATVHYLTTLFPR
jgi:hypothetical protein